MIKINNINLIYNNIHIIKNFSDKILYGEKIALVGSNGCGKSSILKILLKKLLPNNGSVTYSNQIKIQELDQEYDLLEKNNSVLENLSYGKDSIEINKKTYTIIGLLKKFLFSEDQIYSPAKSLSGGEISRLLLLKLFFKPSNVLILDEPTNHLDFKMLNFLEKFLMNYTGTVIFASHDRYFVNKISKKLWFFNKKGSISVNIGDIENIYQKIYKEKKFSLKTIIKKNLKLE
nr:ATP-binding cassette domain-containing protein [Buchnera aphidicola]